MPDAESTPTSCSFVLIDTNIFAEQTRLLRTALGPSLLYFAKIRDVKLVLPDVVRRETMRYVGDAVIERNARLSKALQDTRQFMGHSAEPPMPTAEDVAKSVDARFLELKRWIYPVPLSHDLIIASGERVLNKLPPSHRDGYDAFKDCLIWESLLTLPKGATVHLASNDARAFFDQQDAEYLHPELASGATLRGLNVQAHRTLESLVKALQGTEPEIDHARAQVALNSALAPQFIEAMKRWNVEGLQDPAFALEPYLTEYPGILYVEFKIAARVIGSAWIDDAKYEGALISVEGNCHYDPHGPVSRVQITQESLFSAEGRQLQAFATQYAEMRISLGMPEQRYAIRRPLVSTARSAEHHKKKR